MKTIENSQCFQTRRLGIPDINAISHRRPSPAIDGKYRKGNTTKHGKPFFMNDEWIHQWFFMFVRILGCWVKPNTIRLYTVNLPELQVKPFPRVQTPVHHATKLAQTVVQVLLTTKMAPPQWPTFSVGFSCHGLSLFHDTKQPEGRAQKEHYSSCTPRFQCESPNHRLGDHALLVFPSDVCSFKPQIGLWVPKINNTEILSQKQTSLTHGSNNINHLTTAQVCRIQSHKNHRDPDLWIHRVDIKGSDMEVSKRAKMKIKICYDQPFHCIVIVNPDWHYGSKCITCFVWQIIQ